MCNSHQPVFGTAVLAVRWWLFSVIVWVELQATTGWALDECSSSASCYITYLGWALGQCRVGVGGLNLLVEPNPPSHLQCRCRAPVGAWRTLRWPWTSRNYTNLSARARSHHGSADPCGERGCDARSPLRTGNTSGVNRVVMMLFPSVEAHLLCFHFGERPQHDCRLLYASTYSFLLPTRPICWWEKELPPVRFQTIIAFKKILAAFKISYLLLSSQHEHTIQSI